MRTSLRCGVAAAGLAAGWLVRHRLSPAVRGWTPPSGARMRAGPLAVRRVGDGPDRPVVVLLHGLTASGDWWGGDYDELAARAEVIVPDILGFGGSLDVGRTDFSREAHLDALDSMLVDLELTGRPLTLIGHSMGTLAALHWAVRRPETVQVVLVSAPLYDDRAEAERHITQLGLLEKFFVLNTAVAERTCAFMCEHRGLRSGSGRRCRRNGRSGWPATGSCTAGTPTSGVSKASSCETTGRTRSTPSRTEASPSCCSTALATPSPSPAAPPHSPRRAAPSMPSSTPPPDTTSRRPIPDGSLSISTNTCRSQASRRSCADA
jgi:hypothetical protein